MRRRKRRRRRRIITKSRRLKDVRACRVRREED
jgi:hypothetical protein